MAVKGFPVTGTSTAVRLSPATSDTVSGSSGTITNTGAQTIYIGGPEVTTSGATTGYRLAAGLSVAYQVDQTEAVYGIGAAAWSADVLAQGV